MPLIIPKNGARDGYYCLNRTGTIGQSEGKMIYAGNFEQLLESAEYLNQPPRDVFDEVMQEVAQSCRALQDAMILQAEAEFDRLLSVS
jgi:hypothetical protein